MNLTSNGSRLLATALCGFVLASCDSVKDVRSEPSTAIPTPTVALKGRIIGLGSKRSIVLLNNGDIANGRSFLAGVPVLPSTNGSIVAPIPEGPTVTPFSFGAVLAGGAYNITVREQPYGKNCTVLNGSGVATLGVEINVTVECASTIARFPLTVTIPPSFGSLAGATIRLVTEEAVYERIPAPGQTTVVFEDALFDAAPGGLTAPPFQWSVSAVNTEGGTINRCIVTNSSGSNPARDPGAAPSPSTGFPTVGAPAGAPVGSPCTFTIGGSVAYSTPSTGGTAPAMPAGGMTIQLRDVQGNLVDTVDMPAYGNFTFGGATPREFPSNRNSVFDAAVSKHPAGQACVVGWGGSVNLHTLGLTNPRNITQTATTTNGPAQGDANIPWRALNVFCRAIPAPANRLNGIYRLEDTLATFVVTGGALNERRNTWQPENFTRQNTGSSNMLAFFEDGTFLYGTHAAQSQVEHGFYEYNPDAHTLRFTIISDSGTGNQTTFPTSFTDNQPTTQGLSTNPGRWVVGSSSYVSMGNVQIGGNPRTITGTFGPYGSSPVTGTGTFARQVDWELTEPVSIDGQITGAWASQDRRRIWVYDYNFLYGLHVGVNGGASNMQDACFAVSDFAAPTGFYTRRAQSTGCHPYLRPVPGVAILVQGVEIIDYAFPPLPEIPGFVGRIPGGSGDLEARSPSPTYYAVGSPGNFFSVAPQQYFSPSADLSWCQTEVFGTRATSNGVPIDTPVYFCRTRAN